MEMRVREDDEGEIWMPRTDVAAAIRAIGQDYLQHVPAHASAGEFLEALLDRHADFVLGQVADFFEKGPSGDGTG
ncbi:MAG TPA: hypothetical protein VFI41_05115 [Gemmatimonadales bacterium]|nr:hypothetical protein [Gemmatimonadales bacterium]